MVTFLIIIWLIAGNFLKIQSPPSLICNLSSICFRENSRDVISLFDAALLKDKKLVGKIFEFEEQSAGNLLSKEGRAPQRLTCQTPSILLS